MLMSLPPVMRHHTSIKPGCHHMEIRKPGTLERISHGYE